MLLTQKHLIIELHFNGLFRGEDFSELLNRSAFSILFRRRFSIAFIHLHLYDMFWLAMITSSMAKLN